MSKSRTIRTIDDFFENEEDPVVIPRSDKEWEDYFGLDHIEEDGYFDIFGGWQSLEDDNE